MCMALLISIAMLVVLYLSCTGILRIPCIIRCVTGYDCPFCGFQRSVWALLRGDSVDAFLYNPYIYIISPYIILVFLCVIKVIPRDSRLCRILYSRWSIAIAALLTISWGVLRNILSQ